MKIHSLNISNGGVPKLAVERCEVRSRGLAGDRQRDRRYHGGPERAVSLYSLELIHALRADGHPIDVGCIGENFTLWSSVIAERTAVFTCQGQCYRGNITYDAPLSRYLWCQTLPGDDSQSVQIRQRRRRHAAEAFFRIQRK